MNAFRKGQAPAQNEHTLLMWKGFNVSYHEKNGHNMVNITQMAKPFDKRTRDWLITQQFNELLNALSKGRNLALTDLQLVKHGGTNRGTWLHEDLALIFAQWLSPDFYLACNHALKSAITGKFEIYKPFRGVVPLVIKGVAYYNYLEVLKTLGFSTTSGSVAARKRRFPNQFNKFFGQNFITIEFAKYLEGQKGLYQLKLDLQTPKSLAI